jgi:hypothetical protein
VDDRAAIAGVLALAADGQTASAIARRTGLSRSTIRGWLRGELPSSYTCPTDGEDQLQVDELPRTYPYLLGIYLGDGCISTHPRGVYKLRVSLDAKYPGIIAECKRAIAELVPSNRVWQGSRQGRFSPRPEHTCVEVAAYSKRWPALFPQHGPGKKHERRIELADWQWDAVRANPRGALRGLIHSDGCRSINAVRGWRQPRYSFHNLSTDILEIFERVSELVGVHTTHAPRTVYVSRKADVEVLDSFIGPKR